MVFYTSSSQTGDFAPHRASDMSEDSFDDQKPGGRYLVHGTNQQRSFSVQYGDWAHSHHLSIYCVDVDSPKLFYLFKIQLQ